MNENGWTKLGSLAFAALLATCKPSEPKLPIAAEKLVGILADVHIAEAAIQSGPVDKKDSLTKVYYQQIYEIHGISTETFAETMGILKSNPALLETIYPQVMDDLEKKKITARKADRTRDGVDSTGVEEEWGDE
jgi:hypothetical protein